MLSILLSTIDLFGTPIAMNFSRKEKVKSNFGGTCSLFFFGFILWALFNGSKELFAKNTPKTISYEVYTQDPKEILILPENFPFAFSLQPADIFAQKSYVNEQIFTINLFHTLTQKFKHQNGTSELKQTITNIPTQRCTLDHFGELSSSLTQDETNILYCISSEYSNFKTPSIQGSDASVIYQKVSIQISECSSTTSNMSCAPREIIDSYLLGSWFNVLYGNMAINIKNTSNPISRFQDTYRTMISPNSYKESVIELGYGEISTDLGWLLEDKTIEKFIRVNDLKESFQVLPHPQKVLISCTLEASKFENYHSRAYKKIQDVLAEVAGLANVTFVIILILTTPYSKLKFQEALMNELFDIRLSANKESKRNKKPNQKKFVKKIIEEDKNKNNEIDKPKLESLSARIETKSNMPVIESVMRRLSASAFSLNKPKINFANTNVQITVQESSNHILNKSIRLMITKEASQNDVASNSKMDGRLSVSFKEHSPYTVHLDEKMLDAAPRHKNSTYLEVFPQNFGNEANRYQRANKNVYALKSRDSEMHERSESRIESGISLENSENQVKITRDKQKNALQELELPNSSIGTFNDEPEKINLTIWEYVLSFLYKPKSLRTKLEILDQGVINIDERLNVINILKKLREVDKLKALLLDHDNLILFNNLPKPEIRPKNFNSRNRTSFSRRYLKRSTFIERSASKEQVVASHRKLKQKSLKTEIDEKLLEIFSRRKADCMFI